VTENLIEFTDSNFEAEALGSEKPVLVDVWAPWCGPCRILSPIVQELADSYSERVKVGKLNADENPKVARRYNIRSIPTILLFKNGEIIHRMTGVVPKRHFEKMLSDYA